MAVHLELVLCIDLVGLRIICNVIVYLFSYQRSEQGATLLCLVSV